MNITDKINAAALTVDGWDVRPADQGQIVEYAYGTDASGREMCRVTDRSEREVSFCFMKGDKFGPWAVAKAVEVDPGDLHPDERPNLVGYRWH